MEFTLPPNAMTLWVSGIDRWSITTSTESKPGNAFPSPNGWYTLWKLSSMMLSSDMGSLLLLVLRVLHTPRQVLAVHPCAVCGTQQYDIVQHSAASHGCGRTRQQ